MPVASETNREREGEGVKQKQGDRKEGLQEERASRVGRVKEKQVRLLAVNTFTMQQRYITTMLNISHPPDLEEALRLLSFSLRGLALTLEAATS